MCFSSEITWIRLADRESLFREGKPVNEVGIEDRKLLLRSTSCNMETSNSDIEKRENKK